MFEVTAGLPEDVFQQVRGASLAMDTRMTAAVLAIQDRYHAGAPAPVEEDQALLRSVAAEWFAERNV